MNTHPRSDTNRDGPPHLGWFAAIVCVVSILSGKSGEAAEAPARAAVEIACVDAQTACPVRVSGQQHGEADDRQYE